MKHHSRIETHIHPDESMEEEKNVKSAWTLEVRFPRHFFFVSLQGQQPSRFGNFFLSNEFFANRLRARLASREASFAERVSFSCGSNILA